MAKVLVTGAAGLLGAALCREAAAAGWAVEGTVHRTPAVDGLTVRRLDLRDADAVERTVRAVGPDVIVNCAYVQADSTVTRDGALHVADAAAAHGARLVQLSSDVVFAGGAARPYVEADEPDPLHPYGAAKAAVEHQLAARHPDALVVRTSLLYRRSGTPPDPQTRMALDPAARFFTDEVRCPAEVSELAAALVAAMGPDGPRGVLHLAGADALDRLAFARLLAAAHGRDPEELDGGPGPPQRPKALVLDTSLAASRGLRLRGAREVLAGP